MNKGIFLAISLFSISTYAEAGTPYAGLKYSAWNYDDSDAPEFTLNSLEGVVGYSVNDRVSIEGRFGFGIGDDSDTEDGVKVELEIEKHFGIYVKPRMQMDGFELYGLLGLSRVELKADVSSNVAEIKVTDDETSFSYGVGVDFNATNSIAVNAEWRKLIAGDDYDISGPSVGLSIKY